MATSSFNKIVMVTSQEGIEKLEEVMNSEPEPILGQPRTTKEKSEEEKLVREWLSSLKN